MAKRTKKTDASEVKPTITVLQGSLADALSKVAHSTAPRSTLPVLGNVLLAQEGDRLKVSATNLEIGVSVLVGSMGDETFRTTIPAKTLTDVVKVLSGTLELQLNPKTQTTTITAGRSVNNIRGIDPDEYPLLPAADTVLCEMAGSNLIQLIKRVTPAAAKDESRPILTGVCLDFDDKKVTAAAADGFRLAIDAAPIDRDCRVEVTEKEETKQVPQSFIIPARVLVEVARTIDEKETVVISAKSNTIFFSTDRVSVSSQIIDGKFPPYTALIPKNSPVSVTVDRAVLLRAIKAASVFARDTANIIILSTKMSTTDETPSTLVVSSHAAETGENEGEIDARVTGGDLEVAFNSRYLLELLGVLTSNDVTLYLTDAAKPGLVTEGSYTFVVMPMHIADRTNPKQVNAEGEEVAPQPDPEPEPEEAEE